MINVKEFIRHVKQKEKSKSYNLEFINILNKPFQKKQKKEAKKIKRKSILIWGSSNSTG